MSPQLLILTSVFLPVLLGAAFPFLKFLSSRKAKMWFAGCVLFVSVALTAATCICYAGCKAFTAFTLADVLEVNLYVDNISVLFAGLISFVWCAAFIYAVDYMKHEEEENRFFACFLMVYGVLIGLCFPANLIAMYLFYELMTITSMPMVLHERTKESVMAGLKYLFYSIAGAFLALFFIFYMAAAGFSLNFVPGGIANLSTLAVNKDLLYLATFLSIVGFGSKAGLFPLHSWLPTAHPVAPTPASGVLSGVITKCGVLAIVRVVFFYVGADTLRGTWVQYAWLILTLFTVFMGSMLAYKEPLIKKRLAYSSVSQVSYILFGFATLNPFAVAGALLHVIFHSFIKNTLFYAAGAYIEKTGKRRVDEYMGIGKSMPLTTWCFTIAGLALVGIPPLPGFVSKWYLAIGSLKSDIGALAWLGPLILLVSALLTAGYLLPVTIKGFLPGKDFPKQEYSETDKLMLAAMLILTTGIVILGIFSKPIYDYIFSAITFLS